MTKLEKYQAIMSENYSMGSHLTLDSSETEIDEIYDKMMNEKKEKEEKKNQEEEKAAENGRPSLLQLIDSAKERKISSIHRESETQEQIRGDWNI